MNTGFNPIWRDACQRNRNAIPQLTWLTELRDSAINVLAENGLPDITQEEWRYTSLTDYMQRGAACLANEATAADTATPGPTTEESVGQPHLELLDGLLEGPGSGAHVLSAGIEVHSLRQLSPELRARATGLLASHSTPDDTRPPLAALNLALLSDGLYLRCTATADTPPPPLHLRLTSSGTAMAQPRLLIELAPGSRMSLIIEHRSAAGAVANAVTQVHCGAGSHLDLLRIQDLPADGFLTETTHIELDRDAILSATSLDFGGQLVRQDLSVALNGAGAIANINGAFVVDGHRHDVDRLVREGGGDHVDTGAQRVGLASRRGHVTLGEDRADGAGRLARAAVDAFRGVDVEHLVRALFEVDAVHRADGDAGLVGRVDTRLGDHERHEHPPTLVNGNQFRG